MAVPAPWGCNGCWGSAATRQLGLGSTRCDVRWYVPVVTSRRVRSKSTRPSWEAWKGRWAPSRGEEGLRSHCGSSGSECYRPDPAGGRPGSLGRQPGALRQAEHRSRERGDHRRPSVVLGPQSRRLRPSAKGCSRERKGSGHPAAPSASGGVAAEALAPGHTSGSGGAPAFVPLPRRVHLPIQRRHIVIARAALLSSDGAGCSPSPVAPPRPAGRRQGADTPLMGPT